MPLLLALLRVQASVMPYLCPSDVLFASKLAVLPLARFSHFRCCRSPFLQARRLGMACIVVAIGSLPLPQWSPLAVSPL